MLACRFACACGIPPGSRSRRCGLVHVERAPALEMARADVAHLEADVLRQLAPDAARPRLRVRRLDVRVEDVDRVGEERRQRIYRRRGEGRRAETIGLAEEQRQTEAVVRSAIAERLVAVRRDRDAGVVAERRRCSSSCPAARTPSRTTRRGRCRRPGRRFCRRRPWSVTRPPRHAEARREVVLVGIECMRCPCRS